MISESTEELEGSAVQPLITAVGVQGLFGRYTFEFRTPTLDGKPSQIILLHGENGAGKTTLLQLIWHLLSAANNRGHRSFIARTPFKQLTVILSDNTHVEVIKAASLIGSYDILVRRSGELDLLAHYDADNPRNVISTTFSHDTIARYRQEFAGQASYLVAGDPEQRLFLYGSEPAEQARIEFIAFLEHLNARPLFLADDRRAPGDVEVAGGPGRLEGSGPAPRSTPVTAAGAGIAHLAGNLVTEAGGRGAAPPPALRPGWEPDPGSTRPSGQWCSAVAPAPACWRRRGCPPHRRPRAHRSRAARAWPWPARGRPSRSGRSEPVADSGSPPSDTPEQPGHRPREVRTIRAGVTLRPVLET